MKVVNGFILVVEIEEGEKKTDGGIILPDAVNKNEAEFVEVVDVCEDCDFIKAGDKVVIDMEAAMIAKQRGLFKLSDGRMGAFVDMHNVLAVE